ncbi:Hint domain-containing protein [Marivita sp. S0852]|uniref:Hint domain-containing protein n=1 Tax=Marivita sp. S0852 TaxID=3373893 RepID=UPI0039820EE0
MGNYSIWVLGESAVSLTGGVTLDGITQGDGSHLVGEFMTFTSRDFEEVQVRDNGPDTTFDDNDSSQRLNGAQTLFGTSYRNGTRIEAEYEFVLRDDATGIEYRALAVNFNNSSPSYATNEAVAFVDTVPPFNTSLRVISAREGPGGNGTPSVEASDIVPVCFCRGSRIETRHGLRPVEALRAGDAVRRQDGTFATLRQVFHTGLCADALARNAKLRPVRIMAGALANGLPLRDLLVSRQHRMLISSKIAERMFGHRDVLVPAIKLTALPGIFEDVPVRAVDYYHLLFDAHEVILAEGAPTESLFTGPEALKAVSAEARREILSLFPGLRDTDTGPEPARYIPPGRLQKQLIHRHAKNHKPLLMSPSGRAG